MVEAAKKTGVNAVHPGYGFLSENRLFQEALTKEGIKFIGPGSKAIEQLGDKISSKTIAKKAGVSIIPGKIGEVKNEDDVVKIAHDIGYPVMIKAAHG